jgi:hypothetical protein
LLLQFLWFKSDGRFGLLNPKIGAASSTVTPIVYLKIETASYNKAFNPNLYRINHNVVTNFIATRIIVPFAILNTERIHLKHT